MMFLTSSILLGFIRLSFITFFLFYLNRKFVNVSPPVSFLDFLVQYWFRYTSILLIIIFILVQLNAYNLFNCLFFVAIIIGIDIIGIDNLRQPRKYFNLTLKAGLLNLLKNIENNKKFRQWFAFTSIQKQKKKTSYTLILILTLFIGLVTFASRYYFIIYDNYSLSDAWIYDLHKVIQFDSQLWFSNELSVDGEFALVNFYSKVIDVSTEIALQVIAILESTILSIILFWFIHKITPSKFIAPLIASFSFALVYILTPLNVYFLLKANPIFFALTFALPAFGYFLKPNMLRTSRINYFISFVLAFIAIGMINIFTFCLLVPPFIIIGLFFTKKKYNRSNLLVLLAYVISLIFLLCFYSIACYYGKADFIEFLQTNLLSVSSYTYVPQLLISYDEIIKYAQYATFGGFFLLLLLVLIKKERWRPTFIFFLYFNALIGMTYIQSSWVDVDMLKNSMSVFLPIILGLNVAIIVRILNFAFKKYERFTPITVSFLIIAMIYSSVFYQRSNINSLTESDETPKHILDAYDKISQTFFPFSYCVVNDPETQVISTNKHFFMNYDFFLNDYLMIDSINFKHKKDPTFLVTNPQYSLSKSVLVFVVNDKTKAENNIYALNKQLRSSLNLKLQILKKRGRKVTLFYQSKLLNVYEIINEPNESKISDLIF